MGRFFEPGDVVVMRHSGRIQGIAAAFPVRVVEDSAEQSIVYMTAGTGYRRAVWLDVSEAHGVELPAEYEDAVWNRQNFLRIMYPGVPYSVWAMWNADTWEHTCWYINIESPFQRTPVGFDTEDHELDIVVQPDMSSWRWKDEDGLKQLVSGSIYSCEQAAQFKEFGQDAIRRLESREAPFNEPWPDWRPDPEWDTPVLREDSYWLM